MERFKALVWAFILIFFTIFFSTLGIALFVDGNIVLGVLCIFTSTLIITLGYEDIIKGL